MVTVIKRVGAAGVVEYGPVHFVLGRGESMSNAMQRVQCALVFALIAFSPHVEAQQPFLSSEISFTRADRDSFSDDDVALGVGAGISWIHSLDLGLNYRANQFEDALDGSAVQQRSLELFSRWWMGDQRGWEPGFIFALGAARTEVHDDWITRPYFAGGLVFSAPLVKNQLSLVGEVRGHYYYDAEKLTHKSVGVEPVAALQLKYVPNGADSAPPIPPTSPPVATLRQPVSLGEQCGALRPGTRDYSELRCALFLDRDKDGVPDERDRCSFSVSAIPVDSDGCTIGG